MMQPILYRHSFRALGGINEIQLGAHDRHSAQGLSLLLEEEVRAVETAYSRYRTDSILSEINRAAGIRPVIVDQETASLIDYADACYRESEGLFDLTSGVLRRGWDVVAEKIPTSEELSLLLPLVGWNRVRWRNPELYLPIEGMEIDLGGIGKEYAADRVSSKCSELNVRHALINLGGDVRAIGGQPSGEPWNIGLAHPREPGKIFDLVSLRDGAVATSGDYERYFERDGKRYCHIINPKTGWPVTGFQSVTVIAGSCLIAGTLSTIAMLKGYPDGLDFLKETGLSFLAVDWSGKRHDGSG